ncbi:MAG: hypothetical protein OXC68_05585 [Aestuariivita sp.]|nr:hypothetical protein [Aestuariivita sp.]
MSSHSNILFILGESHAPDLLSVLGHPVIRTPNLDRLATGHFPHESGTGTVPWHMTVAMIAGCVNCGKTATAPQE